MRDVCSLIWLALIGLFRSRASLQAEILTLRHQLNVLRRKSPQRLSFSSIDRLVFAGLYRLAPGRLEDRQAGDRDPLASCWLPSVLALEIKTAQWPSKDPAGNPSAHSRDQSRQPIVGRTTDSWRASQARHRCRTNHRCKVYGEGKATAVPRVEDIPSQSRRRRRVDGPVRGSDNLIPTALRVADTASRSPPNPVVGGDCAPNGGMDFAPAHRGLWLESSAAIHHS